MRVQLLIRFYSGLFPLGLFIAAHPRSSNPGQPGKNILSVRTRRFQTTFATPMGGQKTYKSVLKDSICLPIWPTYSKYTISLTRTPSLSLRHSTGVLEEKGMSTFTFSTSCSRPGPHAIHNSRAPKKTLLERIGNKERLPMRGYATKHVAMSALAPKHDMATFCASPAELSSRCPCHVSARKMTWALCCGLSCYV